MFLRPDEPGWEPDWSDAPCVIVASGPSAKAVDLEAIRGKARVIAVNTSIRLCKWADALYAADVAWWRANGPLWRSFGGLKVSGQASSKGVCDTIRVASGLSGSNGGHQAIDLACRFGARRILLIGFDMNASRGLHWHGRHEKTHNPSALALSKWARRLDGAEFPAEIAVVRETALTAYPVMDWREAVEWVS